MSSKHNEEEKVLASQRIINAKAATLDIRKKYHYLVEEYAKRLADKGLKFIIARDIMDEVLNDAIRTYNPKIKKFGGKKLYAPLFKDYLTECFDNKFEETK